MSLMASRYATAGNSSPWTCPGRELGSRTAFARTLKETSGPEQDGLEPGYDGVHVFSPAGERIGMILLPEPCANVCFGGTKRNQLFMVAGMSLYSVFVETRGAHIA